MLLRRAARNEQSAWERQSREDVADERPVCIACVRTMRRSPGTAVLVSGLQGCIAGADPLLVGEVTRRGSRSGTRPAPRAAARVFGRHPAGRRAVEDAEARALVRRMADDRRRDDVVAALRDAEEDERRRAGSPARTPPGTGRGFARASATSHSRTPSSRTSLPFQSGPTVPMKGSENELVTNGRIGRVRVVDRHCAPRRRSRLDRGEGRPCTGWRRSSRQSSTAALVHATSSCIATRAPSRAAFDDGDIGEEAAPQVEDDEQQGEHQRDDHGELGERCSALLPGHDRSGAEGQGTSTGR